MIQLTAGDPQPKYRQIANALRLQITTGELAPGSKLPSVRSLAMALSVNTNTIVKAYGELTEQGLVESRQGAGIFVCLQRRPVGDRQQQLDTAAGQFITEIMTLEFSRAEVLESVGNAIDALERQKITE